jgi:hypothetical protein
MARPGAVQARDGKRHQGEITFTNNAVQISNDAEVTSIPRADIARVSFDAEPMAPAQESKGQGFGLLGYYFANTNVHGPVEVRLDPTIDFDWGTEEPLPGVGKDYFAIIWMGYLEAPASGEFTFTLNVDDRAKLQVGPDLVIEAARREQQEESTGKLELEQGKRYPVTLLYQDMIGAAKMRLLWSGPDIAKSVIPSDRFYPASFVTEHTANIESARGLLATSYEKADFSGNTSTRVAPTVEPDAATNLTRWTGQLRADYSEPYTFYVATEGPVRLRLDGKAIIDKWNRSGLAEIKAAARLTAGQLYQVELETAAPARLLWNSPSQPKCVIPETHLTAFSKRAEIPSPTGPNPLLPAGVLLRNGSFVACRVESIEEGIVQCSRLLEGKKVPLSGVARIVCQPLPRAMASRVTSGRPGVLLANGDFVEGTFVGMEDTRVTISSVLLGLRTYSTSQQVMAIIFADAEGAPPPCEVQLRDQSILFTSNLELEPGAVVLADKLFAGLRVGEDQIQAVNIR